MKRLLVLKKFLLKSIKRLFDVNVLLYLRYRFTNYRLIISSKHFSKFQKFFICKEPWLQYKTEQFDARINKSLNKYSEIIETSYLYHFKIPVFVEPYFGWLIYNKNKVIKESLPYGTSDGTPLPHYILYQRKKVLKVKKAASIRYNWMNYWHFYNDILGQLYLLDQSDFDKEIPLIVPENCKMLQYVKEFFNTDFAKKWKWIFQDKQTKIQVKEMYVCKTISNVREHFLFAKTFFIANTDEKLKRRIFITRSEQRGRYISNYREIIETLESLEIEIIDCDKITLQEQINLFSTANLIVGIHGAGLTNIIHRYPQSCTLIEIFPPDLIPPHYYWLSRQLGFNYYALPGEYTNKVSFYVNPAELQKAILTIKMANCNQE